MRIHCGGLLQTRHGECSNRPRERGVIDGSVVISGYSWDLIREELYVDRRIRHLHVFVASAVLVALQLAVSVAVAQLPDPSIRLDVGSVTFT